MARRKNRARAATTTANAEQEFERELEVFRTEAEGAAQFLYAWLAVHAAAGDDAAVHRLLNTAPLFWNTALGALQSATFVTLGRIFDQDTAHNLNRLLRIARDNPQIFSKAALGRRKQGASKTPPSWLNDYLRDAYVPKVGDFRRLRAHVRKHRKTYEDKYRDLRHKIFAHKGTSDPALIAALFAKTNIRELQRMLMFLGSFYETLWQLFVNGRKPSLRPRRYSVRSMREKPSPHTNSNAVHERILHEAGSFLTDAARALSAVDGTIRRVSVEGA